MLLLKSLLALPPALLLLIANAPSPTVADHPFDLKYFPEHEEIRRRDVGIQQRLYTQSASAVKKMSPDYGEKFFLDYWAFDEKMESWANMSMNILDSPFRIHGQSGRKLSHLFKRAYECPSGTFSCTSISEPDFCCSEGSTCQRIQDTGYGSVGCCASSSSCNGEVSGCIEGYTSCPNDGGGCCLPGYACRDEGCIQTATVTDYISPSPTLSPGLSTTTVTITTVITPTASDAPPETYTTTVIVVPSVSEPTTEPTTSTSTSTSIIPSPSTTRTTASTTSTYTCPTSFYSCPASIGGGCCLTGRACVVGSICPPESSSSGLYPGIRPTTQETETTTTIGESTSYSSIPNVGCPTGFYGCKAFHQGGCCRTGRNCDTTSCPVIESTTLINSNGITAAAPTGSGITAPGQSPTGQCAQGWFSCAASLSGGCCPSGYDCLVSTCTATVNGQGAGYGKEQPNMAGWSKEFDRIVLIVSVCVSSVVLGMAAML